MQPETAAAVFDMRLALGRIREATIGVELPEFEGDWVLQSAVERQFQIVGEAMVRIRNAEAPIFEQFEDGKKIVGLRNLLAHGYDAVSPRILLETAQEKVPQLIPLVDALTEQAERERH